MREPCRVCAHSKSTGSFGLAGKTHCRDCHRTWSGTTQAHCVRCHQHFSCVRAADRHMVFADELDSGYCLHPSDVLNKREEHVLAVRVDVHGPTWHFAEDRVFFLGTPVPGTP